MNHAPLPSHRQLASRLLSPLAALLLIAGCDMGSSDDEMLTSREALEQAVASDARKAENRARDKYRHPAETLAFFGVEPDQTVVELWPGGGWYSEILAPYLQDAGTLYLAHFATNSPREYRRKAVEKTRQWIDQSGYDHASLTSLSKGSYNIAPPESVDTVLTFRNLHNWLAADYMQQVFDAAYRALKPGGVLGVVEHRAKPGTDLETMKKSGYVTEKLAIAVAQSAGFEPVESSEINANPKDSADHPAGVWTLPPSLRLKDQDKDKYLAIGESDRMTLKFVKPAN